jgi:uncharacterized membrane protein
MFICALIIIALSFVLPPEWQQATRLLVAWNSGVGLFLVLVGWMMARSSLADLRCRAAEDEGKMTISVVTAIAAIASLAAIIAELATAKAIADPYVRAEHIALAGITVILSWCFMQTIFALHYAHEFYDETKGKQHKGLEFPGTAEPDYWDFVYFSFIIGTAAQTADVNITSQVIRRLVTLHCLIVFFFNVMILALMINIGAGLI